MTECVWLHGTALAGVPWHHSLPGAWPDLPGHGRAPRTRPTVASYANALAPTLPEHFFIGGHSLGGMVALQIACLYPDRCLGLVLVDAPLRLPVWIPRQKELAAYVAWPEMIGPVLQYRTWNAAMRPAIRRAVETTPRQGLIDAIHAATAFDGRALARRVSVPVLSLIGSRSQFTDRTDHVGETKVYQAGHMLPFDRSEQVANDIHAFLDRCG